MDRHWFLQGRLSPPAFRVPLLERPALTRLLNEGLAYKAVHVAAPAGYGKTALLSQWRSVLQARSIPCAWISIAPSDSDPAQLLTFITLSLIAAGVSVGPIEHLAEQWFADTPIEAAVTSLITQLAQEPRPLVIFVDDIHNAPRVLAQKVLAPLLQPGLAHVHFVLAGRGRPPLPLANLRARGDLLSLEADALRFDGEALATLLPGLTRAQRDLLTTRTQGWPVALQLARLWLDARPERVELIEGFSGHTTEVAEFLTEQVLADLPAAISHTLEITSPLDALCADVVAAITGERDSWQALIEHPSLVHLVVPLDEARAWYKLHPLLADYLRDRLHQRAPALEAQCHSRASAWFEENNMRVDAVRHAAAAGDMARAAALVEQAGGWRLVIFGGATLMRALLAEIPADRLAQFPRVELYRALLDAKRGALRAARAHFEEGFRILTRQGHVPSLATPTGRDLLVTRHLLGRYQDLPLEAGDLQALDAQLNEGDGVEDDLVRAALLNTGCLIGLGLGEMQASRRACERAVAEMRRLGAVLGVNYCTLHLGLATLYLGHRREAEAMFREATELAEENFGIDSGLRAAADVHLAVALVKRGDLETAAQLFNRSLAQVETFDGWLDVYAESYEAAIALALAEGNSELAQDYLRRATSTAERRNLPRLEALSRALRARIFLRSGRLGEARQQLSARREEWRDVPFHWRENHLFGVVSAEVEIASGNPVMAGEILAPLLATAQAGARVREARSIRFLNAIALYARGEHDSSAVLVVNDLETALREEDTEYLVDFGPVAASLLHFTRQWTRERAASSLARQALGLALARLSALTSGSHHTADAPSLSARELEVLTELVQGSPNKVIARALQMTENTVKFHLKNVFQKLGVQYRAQAVRVARERGLVR